MNQVVIVTGASAGIGEGFARAFAEKGYDLALVARREERLKALAVDIETKHRVKAYVVVLDLSQAGAADKLYQQCQKEGWQLHGLVNNAGLGILRDLSALKPEELTNTVMVDYVCLVELMNRFLPGMIERGNGFILNVASTAAFQPLPHFSLYGSVKAGVLSLTEAVHEEVKAKGVTVTCLCPGPVHTEFQKVAGIAPRFFAAAQSVDEVVRVGMRAIEQRRAMVRTNWYQALFTIISSRLPRPLIRKLAQFVLELSDPHTRFDEPRP